VTLDLSNCAQVGNSVVRAILQGCPVLESIRLDRCHRITDSAFDVSESPFQFLVGCLSLQAISLQARKTSCSFTYSAVLYAMLTLVSGLIKSTGLSPNNGRDYPDPE
jgi:hypothetical protein